VSTETAESLVASALADGAATFADLLRCLPGMWPPDVSSALVRLASAGRVDDATVRQLTTVPIDGDVRVDDGQQHLISLPPPHPLDYDWRFDGATVTALLDRCLRLADPGDTVVLLGTPTLMRAALEVAPERRFILLDRNRPAIRQLAAVRPEAVRCCDLAHDPIPALAARVVVADPPWYSSFTRHFLWAAAQVSAVGARILLCQPPCLTRPGVLAERAGDLAWAERAGLVTVGWQSGALRYATPAFEQRALSAAGLSWVPDTWRRGDLVELVRARSSRPRRPPRAAEPAWDEVCDGQVRVRFRGDRRDGPVEIDPRLIRLVPGDILMSVSRRHPLHQRADVWTGSNRVFRCRAPLLAAGVARALIAGRDPEAEVAARVGRPLDLAELGALAGAVDQMARLLDVEMRDHASGELCTLAVSQARSA
jgi:hypothetical protein